MTTRRRLLVVSGLILLAALASTAHLWGDPPIARRPGLALPGDTKGPANDVEAKLAQSRFATQSLLTYKPVTGAPLFAWQLRPDLPRSPRQPRDLAILVCTTANQAGAPWNAARQLAAALIEKAGPEDRVSLWTVNSREKGLTRNLMTKFLSPRDDAKKIKLALEQLDRLTPMGVADLPHAVQETVASFDEPGRQKLIIYLGDGRSLFNPMTSVERNDLNRKMVENRVTFFSVPLGKDMEPANLHGLATGSGGCVVRVQIFEDKLADALERAEQAFAAPVLYPTKFTPPEDASDIFPVQLPPLRSDMPTLVLGSFKELPKQLTCTIQGTLAGQPQLVTRTLTLPVPAPEDDNYFLVSMANQWKHARQQPAMIRADRALVFAFEENRLKIQDLLAGGYTALHQKQFDTALQMYRQAQAINPHNKEARTAVNVVNGLREGKFTWDRLQKQLGQAEKHQGVKLEKKAGQVRFTQGEMVALAQLADPKVADPRMQPQIPAVEREDLLQRHRDAALIEEQKLTQTVEAALRQYRRDLNTDPEKAHDVLRAALLQVRDHPDLAEKVRDSLTTRLQAALRDVSLRGEVVLRRKAEQQRLTTLINKGIEEDARMKAEEERTATRIASYRALMNRARYEEHTMRNIVEGMVTMQKEARMNGTPVPQATQVIDMQVQARYNLQKLADLRHEREQNFLRIMMDIEKTHVPFPDEPPIHFPPLAMWKALAELRKEKYEVSTLPDDPKARKDANRINNILEEPVNLADFQAPDLNLKLFLGLIYERLAAKGQEVPILVDTEAFRASAPEAYPAPEDVYNVAIKIPPQKIKLALGTILRLALGQMPAGPNVNATYVIRRSHIEITTDDLVLQDKVLRIYPVGELVIPISQMGGGFQIGGQIGQIGGQIGQIGGFQIGGQIGQIGGFQIGGQIGGFQIGGQIGGFQIGGQIGGFQIGGQIGGFQIGGQIGGFQIGGQIGGFQIGGQIGGFQIGGQIGGFQIGGFQIGGQIGQIGGFQIGGQIGGFQIQGGFNLNPAQNVAGNFPGGFNGNLGFMGATQAAPLIQLVTTLVAPGEWFVTPGQQAAQQFQGGFMGANMAGFMGQGFMGMGGGPPVPVAQGGSGDPRLMNTIDFFAPALALVVRAPSRIHYKVTGGIIGRPKKLEPMGALDNNKDRILVKDDGKGGKKIVVANAAGEEKDPKKDPKKDPLARLQIKDKDGKDLDPRTIWEEGIAKAGGDPGLIIAVADFLFEHDEYWHAAEFLKANLRHGIIVRPWVYEALALAMELSGTGSPEEIRQARLSAISLDPHDASGFIKAAQTMAEHREWERAIAFCKQAALLEPNTPQPYANALAYAELSKDSRAMEWAATELLSQDWPVDSPVLHLKAQAKVDALAGALQRENRQKEADQLRTTLAKLRQRDLVIKLSWEPGPSGPADLELQVKEPNGSICSSQQRMTPGGGLLSGNNLGSLTRATYVASQAFGGDYEVTIRRLWGQPLGNKARLEIIQHQGTPKETSRIVTVQLNGLKHEQTIRFAEGRRTEPAVLPPADLLQSTSTASQSKEPGVVSKLRALADPINSGMVPRGGVSSPLMAGRQEAEALPAAGKSTGGSVAFQSGVVSPESGVSLTTRGQLTPDGRQLRLTVTPNFNLRPGAAPTVRPNLSVPLIPGADR